MKNITYILLLFSLSIFGQRPNNFNDSTYFARSVRFQVPPYIIQGAGNGKVLTSDANGRATWQTFSSSGVSQGALNDSISAVRSIRKVDTLYRNSDSLVFNINAIRYAILDSTGGVPSLQAVTAAGNTSTIDINLDAHLRAAFGVEAGNDANGGIVTIWSDSPTGYKTQIKGQADASTDLDLILPTVSGSRYMPVSVNGVVADLGGNIVLDLITSDSLAQIRQEISDTATQIRSEIPDVSNFATINNLADTSALLRSLIPATATFTILKNSAKDSIVTVFNGIRSAVKDSVANLTNYVTNSSTSILTNKRITARVDSTTSSATPTINTDNVDTYKLTAQAADITSFTTNLSGTPTDDQILHIVITGTASRLITWGSKFEASTVALPTTTVSTNRLDVYFIWNTAVSKWRCGGVW